MPHEPAATDADIDPVAVKAMIDRREPFVLIGVREPQQWQIGHIPYAKIIRRVPARSRAWAARRAESRSQNGVVSDFPERLLQSARRVLPDSLVPKRDHRIDSRRPPRRSVTGQDSGAQQNRHRCRECQRIVGFHPG